MESNVEELEKLKRRLTLELSLEEVEPHYRNVMRQLRSTRLNGFRPGKFPKGWLEKRFKSVMHHEAIEHVIPGFIDEALQKNELQQATQAVISELEFDQKQPLKAVIEFEIKPPLELPDYKKFKLTRKEVESVKPEEVEEELKKTQNNLAQVEDLPEDAIAEDQNLVVLEVKNSGEEDYLPENNLNFELGGERLEVFFDSVKGMKVGDEKSAEIKFSLESKTEEKSKSKFDIRLRSLRKLKVPELDQDFFDRMQVKDLDEMKSKLEENLQFQKESALKAEYRSSILEQLPKQYDAFDLPEALIHEKEHELEHRIEEQTKSEDPKAKPIDKEKEIEDFKEKLRLNFMIDTIGRLEEVTIDREAVAGEFIQMAMMFNQSADELIKTPYGSRLYNQILSRRQEESSLDRVVARVFGDPIEIEEDKTKKETVAESNISE
tara:strand:- start:22 stop:1326 length:1305 start_codon:yes stop_codon:yes gene_type:complete